MAIFNFFSSKVSSKVNYVAFDLDALKNKAVDWTFLSEIDNPTLWIFTSSTEQHEEKLKEFEAQKIPIRFFGLPTDSRQSPYWVLGMALETFRETKDAKLYLSAALPLYSELCEALKKKGISIDFLLIPAKQEKKSQNLSKQKTEKKTKPQNESNEISKEITHHVESADSKVKKKKRLEPQLRTINQEYLQTICDGFKEHFELNGIYEKNTLGELVKLVTGKTVQQVFHTRNAKLYVGCLFKSECIESVDDLHWKLIKFPTPEIFPSEVKVLPKMKKKLKKPKSD